MLIPRSSFCCTKRGKARAPIPKPTPSLSALSHDTILITSDFLGRGTASRGRTWPAFLLSQAGHSCARDVGTLAQDKAGAQGKPRDYLMVHRRSVQVLLAPLRGWPFTAARPGAVQPGIDVRPLTSPVSVLGKSPSCQLRCDRARQQARTAPAKHACYSESTANTSCSQGLEDPSFCSSPSHTPCLAQL